jgi:alpha-beta hydrolase superfamily lysophospholipase
MTSTTSEIVAGDGTALLTRRWEFADPRANVLIVHGLGEHSGRYEHVGAFLVDRGYAVTSFDLRGHGASGGPRVDLESFSQYLDDLEQVVGETARPLVVYGHSMGGLIATSYAVSSRPQPDAYVLSAPALRAATPALLRLIAGGLSRIAPNVHLPTAIKGEQLSRDPEVGAAYFADPLVNVKATARFAPIVFAEMTRIASLLPNIDRPTLVIHGAEDEIVPPDASAPLAAVPGVERKLFPGLRHETHNEPEQAEVLGFVAGWLDRQFAA